jgi:hypothetical protein
METTPNKQVSGYAVRVGYTASGVAVYWPRTFRESPTTTCPGIWPTRRGALYWLDRVQCLIENKARGTMVWPLPWVRFGPDFTTNPAIVQFELREC